MKPKFLIFVLAFMLLVPFTACSGGGNPSVPTGDGQSVAGLVPNFTPPIPPRDPDDIPFIPPNPEYAIELNPAGDMVEGNFTFGDVAMKGIEVRINDEIADVTDDKGNFEIPSILDGEHTISFGIAGEIFHTQPYSPVSRFAQNDPAPGPGVMAGTVFDDAGPVAGALVVVVKGDNYAYAFSGQYGQYEVTGAPAGNVLAVCMADFHDPVFDAVVVPDDGTPLEKDFYLPQNNTYGLVYGRVVARNFGAVPHALVTYTAPGVFRADLSNIFGIFELEAIPVGVGHIKMERDFFYTVEGDIQVHSGVNPIGIITQLIEQSTVHGHVVNEAGQPMNGVLVRLAVWDNQGEYPMVYGRISGPGGYFHFEDLLPGAYLIQGFQPGYYPAYESGFILPGTLHEETLVMVPGSGGHAFGWIKTIFEVPVPGAVVVLDYIGDDLAIATVADDNGWYEFPGIPFGACAITAYSAENLPKTGSWDVLPNENEGLGIFVWPMPEDAPTGEVFGTLLDSSDQPIPYSLVWIYNMANPAVSFMMMADENGEYSFPNVLAGTNGGWGIANGYIADDGYVEVIEGEEAELNFTLFPQ